MQMSIIVVTVSLVLVCFQFLVEELSHRDVLTSHKRNGISFSWVNVGCRQSVTGLDLLSNRFLVSSLANVLLSGPQGINQGVDLTVEFGEVLLDVLLLGIGILVLLVSMEFLEALFVLVLDIAAILLLEDSFLVLNSLAVGGLLHHESVSSLQGLGPDVLRSLWEEFAELV